MKSCTSHQSSTGLSTINKCLHLAMDNGIETIKQDRVIISRDLSESNKKRTIFNVSCIDVMVMYRITRYTLVHDLKMIIIRYTTSVGRKRNRT